MKKEKTIVYARLISLNENFPNIDIKKNLITFGRRDICDIILEALEISANHCQLKRQKIKEKYVFVIKDLSSNGTFINGTRVGRDNEIVIQHGDYLTFVTKKWENINKQFNAYLFQDLQPFTEYQNDDIYKHYDIKHELGQGNFSIVKYAVHRMSGQAFAVKIIDKKKSFWLEQKNQEHIRQEVEILKTLRHPNIINYNDIYESENHIYIVLELASGGELFQVIYDKGPFSEQEALKLFTHILNAVSYLHSKGIAHRDLKPENILLGENSAIKITDFGLARFTEQANLMKTLCGTPHYLAPEIIKLGMKSDSGIIGYGTPVDMWSLGVILYVMLTGQLPFYDDDRHKLFTQIESGVYSFPDDVWIGISEEAKDLVKKLLQVDPNARLTAHDALSHPWICSEKLYQSEGKADTSISDSVNQDTITPQITVCDVSTDINGSVSDSQSQGDRTNNKRKHTTNYYDKENNLNDCSVPHPKKRKKN